MSAYRVPRRVPVAQAIPEPTFISPNHAGEWEAAWATLATYLKANGLGDGSDLAQENPESCEVWQYMGTWGDRHEWRHRDHPKTGGRVVARTGAV